MLLGEEVFERVFDESPIGMAVISPEGRFLSINNSFCSILERSREDCLGLDFQTVSEEPYLSRDMELLGQCLDGSRSQYDLLKTYIMPDARRKWVLLSVSAFRDEATGEIMFFVSQVTPMDPVLKGDQAKDSERSLQEKMDEVSKAVERVRSPNDYYKPDVSLLDGVLEEMDQFLERRPQK